MPTVEDLLKSGSDELSRIHPNQAESYTIWTLAHCLNLNRTQLLTERHRQLTAEQVAAWTNCLTQLLDGVPLQYVLGDTDFMGLTLRCDSRALIPRPETEQLVDWVVGDADLWKIKKPRIADVGTGTGCIVLALGMAREDAELWAVDASPDALSLAQENAETLGLAERISWVEGNLASDLIGLGLHAIVSNPPYIAEADWEGLELSVKDQEPRMALTAGADGLDCIRELIATGGNCLRPGGKLYMEIDEKQESAIAALGTNWTQVEFKQDLAGRTRFVRMQR